MKLNRSLSFLVILMGCQPEFGSGSKPMPSFLPSSSATATPSPSSLPSVEPSSIATVLPQPQATRDPRLGSSYFTNQISCLDVSEKERSRLEAPRDLVVSQDGKTVFATPDNAFVKAWRWNILPPQIPRTPIYQLKDGQLSILNLNGNDAYTCGFNGEIERWESNQLLFAYPIVRQTSNKVKGFIPPIRDYVFYATDGVTTKSLGQGVLPNAEIEDADMPEEKSPSVFISQWPANRMIQLQNLENNQLSYQLYTANIEYNSLFKLHDLNQQKSQNLVTINNITGYSAQLFLNIIDSNNVFLNLNASPLPILGGMTILSVPQSLQCQGWSAKNSVKISSQPRFYQGEYYFSDALNHMIWAFSYNRPLRCIAGGRKGYSDGKGLEASFNQPSELDIDAAGNIYVADTGNNAIRKITSDGDVTTLYRAPDIASSK